MEVMEKREAWNKGKLVGQKPPLKPKDIWGDLNLPSGRTCSPRSGHVQPGYRQQDSRLRSHSLRVRDVTHGIQIVTRAMVVQRKTQRPVQFELTEPTRQALGLWLEKAWLQGDQYLFPSRVARSLHVSTRQYDRIVHHWTKAARLDSSVYGTHSILRIEATLIYKRTKNLKAVQLLLGHSKRESTVRYLGIEVDDALEISEQTEIFGPSAAAPAEHAAAFPASCQA